VDHECSNERSDNRSSNSDSRLSDGHDNAAFEIPGDITRKTDSRGLKYPAVTKNTPLVDTYLINDSSVIFWSS
jgi:hypothetical protein